MEVIRREEDYVSYMLYTRSNTSIFKKIPIKETLFIPAMLYDGKENESYIDTRIRICNKLNQNICFVYYFV